MASQCCFTTHDRAFGPTPCPCSWHCNACRSDSQPGRRLQQLHLQCGPAGTAARVLESWGQRLGFAVTFSLRLPFLGCTRKAAHRRITSFSLQHDIVPRFSVYNVFAMKEVRRCVRPQRHQETAREARPKPGGHPCHLSCCEPCHPAATNWLPAGDGRHGVAGETEVHGGGLDGARHYRALGCVPEA